MYKLIYFNENNEKIYSDKKITEDDIIKIKNIGKLFFDVLLSLDYYNIVNDNLIEIMENIKKLDLNVPKNFAKINRYFINISNSFYMYQSFYEKQFKNKYKFVFSNIYDNYDNYVLMYNLRNYVVHNTLAITKLTFDINKNECKAIIKPTEIIKDKKNLDSKCKKIIRNMITNKEEIDLKYFVGEFFSVFNKLQIDIMDELKKEIILNLDLLEEYLIGDNIKKAESYIVDEQDNIILSPSNIFYSLFIKIGQEYKFDINVTDFLNDYYNL